MTILDTNFELFKLVETLSIDAFAFKSFATTALTKKKKKNLMKKMI